MLSLGVIAALALASPETSGSERPGVELRWSAPAGCPERAQVQAWLDELVPEPMLPQVVRAEITVEQTPGGFGSRLVLDAGTASQTRQLEAPECDLLARANVVVVAVGLDPLAVAEATARHEERSPRSEPRPPADDAVPEPARPPADDATAPAEPARPRPTPPTLGRDDAADAEARPERPPELELGVRLGGGLEGLLLPGTGLGLVVAPWLGTARLRVRAVAQLWPGRRVAFAPDRDAAGVVQLVSGGVRLCPVLGRGALRVPLCAGVDGGAVLGRGTGDALTTSLSASAPWAGVVLQPGVELAVARRVSLWAALEGVISLYRPAFAVEGIEGSWTMGAGGLRGLVGIEIHRAREIP